MNLLIDIGNTRVKWTVQRGMRLGRVRAIAHESDPAVARRILLGAPRGIRRIVAVNVAGKAFERALVKAARERFELPVEVIRSTRQAGGVRNGYHETWRLGADRWVGAIGAWSVAQGEAVVVANAGTALTVDAVSAAGQHLGGVIVPGAAAMIDTMLSGTHGIRRRARGGRATGGALLATNTASALAAGAAHAGAALIDRAVSEAAKVLRVRPVLLLTGGGARDLAPHVESAHRIVPDLVLRGLAALVDNQSG